MTDHATYELKDIPAVSAQYVSKYALATTEAGWSVGGPGAVACLAFSRLVDLRKAACRAFQADTVTVKLQAVVEDASVEGGYALRPRGEWSAVPAYKSSRPGKLIPWPADEEPLLDSFFGGGAAWDRATDLLVFKSAVVFAQAFGLKGNDLRSLNDSLAVAVLCRAGIEADRSRLPNVER